MDKKLACWEIEVGFKQMDMSGGDAVDGERWTGKWLDVKATVAIVATDEAIASAVALTLFYAHQRPAVKEVKKLRDVHAVVSIANK